MDMGLLSLSASIRGSGGETPTGDRFFDLFEPEPTLFGPEPWPDFKLIPSETAWQSALIELFAVDARDLTNYTEPSEEFATRVKQGFLRAAQWMTASGTQGLQQWRDEGRKADICIIGWLLNEQLDLSIPSEFLKECGRLKLPITICTND